MATPNEDCTTCVKTPDGTWLTDTTAIMERFEPAAAGPLIRPAEPAATFCSLVSEDFFDEWYWGPALYYRWSFDEDAKLMSNQIARTLMSDVSLPFSMGRRRLRAFQKTSDSRSGWLRKTIYPISKRIRGPFPRARRM